MTADHNEPVGYPEAPPVAVPAGTVAPIPKVAAAGAAGALTTVLVFVAEQRGVDIPPEVAAALTALIAFAAGYLRG